MRLTTLAEIMYIASKDVKFEAKSAIDMFGCRSQRLAVLLWLLASSSIYWNSYPLQQS